MAIESQIKYLSPKDLKPQDKNQIIYGSAMPINKGHMPGENATELHPDDIRVLEEREELMRKRQELHALAYGSHVPSFREDVEPPGGYDTTGQPGDLLLTVDPTKIEIDIEPELEKIA